MGKFADVESHLSQIPMEVWRRPGKVKEVAAETGASTRTVRKVREQMEQCQADYAAGVHVWVPVKKERWALFADEHHPYGNTEAQEIAHDYAATKGVDGIVLQGDFCDFFKISHWKNDPSRMRFVDELDCCDSALEKIANQFRGSRRVYIQGNHEQRMQRYLWSCAPELAGLSSLEISELLRLPIHGFEYFDNSKRLNKGLLPFTLGKLHVIHGHEMRCSPNVVNIARVYYLKAGVNIAVGHHHQPSEYIQKLLNHKHEGAWSVGCLCELSEEYAPVTNWCHGFAMVDVYPDGTFEFQNRKIIEGKVL